MSTNLILKKDEDRRLRAGHCWVYSNEIDTEQTPLRDLSPGAAVEIVSHKGQWLGWGYANPHSLICARVVSRDRAHPLDRSLIVHRLNIALSLRERLYSTHCYRLVYGEADGLPGLVVDRFGDILVAQITTAGMEQQREAIVEALQKVLNPRTIVLRNDSSARAQEGLDTYVEILGETPPEEVEVIEGAERFGISVIEGQKTGWFFDQAANRDRLLKYVAGKRVLDVFSYVGAWGIRCAAAGASEVICVDSSERALAAVTTNAARNAVADRVQTLRGDAFNVLRDLKAAGQRFDVIVLDPPAFIKRRKDGKEGQLAYRRINEAALTLLERDGLLATASCSFHMAAPDLLRTVQQAARASDRSLQLLEQGQQAPDHPVHPAIPETAYLKAFYLRVLPTF